MKMVEIPPKGYETLWKKDKLLVTSNFSFSCSVFKILALQTGKNKALFGDVLNLVNSELLETLSNKLRIVDKKKHLPISSFAHFYSTCHKKRIIHLATTSLASARLFKIY